MTTVCTRSKARVALIFIGVLMTACALDLLAMPPAAATIWTLGTAARGVTFSLASTTGRYAVIWRRTGWTYAGKTSHPPVHIRRERIDGTLGRGVQIRWQERGVPTVFSATLYPRRHTLLFTAAHAVAGGEFPVFTQAPRHLLHLSLSNHQFTPPEFSLVQTATPWVFFDRKFRAAVFAPASEILVSRLYGNGVTLIADGFNPGTRGSALHHAHATLLVFGRGIRRTIEAWGRDFRTLHHRRAVPPASTPLLRSLGYWTDHGATYYYHYRPRDGYTGTLRKIVAQFEADRIHLGYLELDSWWYEKSHHFYNGQPAGPLNPHLPTDNRWNAFGGIWRYRAAPQLFPHGLAAFDRELALPLVVHTRWMAFHSPYRQRYHFSGIAPSSRAYWRSRARYLAHAGVRAVLQDWLVEIYRQSPALHTHLSVGRDFTHGMAAALAARRIAVLYSMETSRFLLEAGELPDVIAMRGGRDRFQRKRWRNFLYSSLFIHAVGAWPWSDVFMSRDRGDLLLSLLSGGPVGIGDRLGHLDATNIRWATRAGGRLVQPALPLTPTDQTMLNDALGRKEPLVATTHTGRLVKSTLVFVYRRRGDRSAVALTPRTLGLAPRGHWIGLEYFKRRAIAFSAQRPIDVRLAPRQWTYWILAPVLPSGIAVLGDLRQAVPASGERLLHLRPLRSPADGARLEVRFAAGEKTVPLTFFSRRTPQIRSDGTVVPVVPCRRLAHLYRVSIPVRDAAFRITQHGKAVRIASVRIIS